MKNFADFMMSPMSSEALKLKFSPHTRERCDSNARVPICAHLCLSMAYL
ncbi:hypothetical protein [Methanosarcina barkeri]|nr:hypothetical protein [Methanosarcina barkeri]